LIKFIVIAVVIVIGLFLLARRFGGARIEPQQTRPGPPTVSGDSSVVTLELGDQEIQVDAATMARIRGLLAAGDKIEAIKLLREATGLGLTEAKSLADSLAEIKQ
jgi:hypothetical protein